MHRSRQTIAVTVEHLLSQLIKVTFAWQLAIRVQGWECMVVGGDTSAIK